MVVFGRLHTLILLFKRILGLRIPWMNHPVRLRLTAYIV